MSKSKDLKKVPKVDTLTLISERLEKDFVSFKDNSIKT